MNPVASENERNDRNYKNCHENREKRDVCHAEHKLIYKSNVIPIKTLKVFYF